MLLDERGPVDAVARLERVAGVLGRRHGAARFVLSTTPASRVPLAAFRHLERVARTRLPGRAQGETADEYIERLLAARSDRRSQLELLRRAFNAARYGTAPAAPASEVVGAFSIAGAAFR